MVKMKYLVSRKEDVDLIDRMLEMIPPEIKANVSQARLPSSRELHLTMTHHHFKQSKEIILPKSLGRLIEIESISTGNKNELVMSIKVELEDGTILFMLFEHMELLMRVKFES